MGRGAAMITSAPPHSEYRRCSAHEALEDVLSALSHACAIRALYRPLSSHMAPSVARGLEGIRRSDPDEDSVPLDSINLEELRIT